MKPAAKQDVKPVPHSLPPWTQPANKPAAGIVHPPKAQPSQPSTLAAALGSSSQSPKSKPVTPEVTSHAWKAEGGGTPHAVKVHVHDVMYYV